MYREFQQKLPDNKLSMRQKSVEDLNTSVKTTNDLIKSLVNHMDHAALAYYMSCRIYKFTDNVQSTHEQKLIIKLGARLDLSSRAPSKVVFNYIFRSSVI